MSECLHIHDDEGHDIGFVCVPERFWYVPRVHEKGARTYKVLGRPTRSLTVAFDRVRDAMLADRNHWLNRGDILADEGPESYYEPHIIYEVFRR